MAKRPVKSSGGSAAVRARWSIKHVGRRYEEGEEIKNLAPDVAAGLAATGHELVDPGAAEPEAAETE